MSAAQSLPLEIISKILSLLPDRFNKNKDDFLALLNASHVCRQWYIASLSFSYPWAAQAVLPDVMSQQACEVTILRAGNLPVSVESSQTNQDSQREARFQKPTWRLVLENLGKVKEMCIDFEADDQDEVTPLRQLLTKAAPLLQRCQLNAFWCEKSQYQREKLRVFDGDAPALKCLSLHACLLPREIDISAFSLNHLYLDMSCDELEFIPTFTEWLDLLGSQSLEVLTIWGFRYRGHASTTPQVISFPRLVTLFLNGDTIHCGDLFRALAIPPGTCDVQIQTRGAVSSLPKGMERGISQYLADLDLHIGQSSSFWWSLFSGTQGQSFRLLLRQCGHDEECSCFSSDTCRPCRVHLPRPRPNSRMLINLDNHPEDPLVNLLSSCLNSPLLKRRTHFTLATDSTTDPKVFNEIKHFLSALKDTTYNDYVIADEIVEDCLEVLLPGCDLCSIRVSEC